MFAMSLAAKVAALRSFMGVPDDAPLPAAVEMMNFAMGAAAGGRQVSSGGRGGGGDCGEGAL